MNPRTLAVLLVLLVATSVTALQMDASPSSLTFLSGETEQVTLELTNDAASDVEVVSLTRLDSDSDVLTTTPALPIALAPGESTTVTIDVTSTNGGTYTVQLEAEDNSSATSIDTFDVEVLVETGFSAGGDLELGGDNQRRDDVLTGSITLDNDRAGSLTDLTVTNTIPSRYAFSLSSVPSTISAFSTATVTYEIEVPLDQDSGREKIGEITFTGAEASDTIEVFLEVEAGLVFDSVDVETDDDSDSRLRDGDTIDIEFRPGDRVIITATIENRLDIDIEDVRVELLIEDIDDRDDIEERSDRIDIRDGDDEDFEIEFTIPSDVEEDVYDVILTVSGDDEDGGFHEAIFELELEIELERDDLEVTRFSVSPLTVCTGDTVRIDTTVRNVGSRDQDDARVVVEIDGLNLADARSFSVDRLGDRDDEYDASFTLSVPNSAREGSYTIRALAYYDTDALVDAAVETLVVQDCDDSGSDGGSDGSDGGSDGSDGGVIIIEPETPPPTTDNGNDDDVDRSSVYVWLLVGLNVLVIVLILVFVVRLLTR